MLTEAVRDRYELVNVNNSLSGIHGKLRVENKRGKWA
jgi:hypothetical protein